MMHEFLYGSKKSDKHTHICKQIIKYHSQSIPMQHFIHDVHISIICTNVLWYLIVACSLWIFSFILHSTRDIQYLHRFALYKHSMHMYVSRLGYECIQFIWRTIKIRSMNLIWNNMISYGWIAITLVMVSIFSVWKYIKLSAKYENYRHFEILSVKFQLSGWFCWSSGDM